MAFILGLLVFLLAFGALFALFTFIIFTIIGPSITPSSKSTAEPIIQVKHHISGDVIQLPVFDKGDPRHPWTMDFKNRWQSHEPLTNKKIASLLPTLPGGTVIIDCGAHVGDTGLFMALSLSKKTNIPITVYEIDPDASKLAFIKAVMELNGVQNLRTFHGALSKSHGKGKLNKKLHPGGWTVENGNDFPIYPLDSLLNSEECVSFMKLDVEGMEEDVLYGAQRIIERDRPVLLLEYTTNVKRIDELMKRWGYNMEWHRERDAFFIPKK